MNGPFAFKPEKAVTQVGHLMGAPLAVQDFSWLPLIQVFFWSLFTVQARKKYPDWSAVKSFLLGLLKMMVVLGSEWGHNTAHIAAARAVGKPVDRVRILLGMPLLLYNEPEHPSITPRQHLIRSLGGPVFNFILLAVSKILHRRTARSTFAREIADAAVGMNTFIAAASLLPVPVFDGGPVLKWTLIDRGYSPRQSEKIIENTNRVIGAGLVGAFAINIQKRRWLVALILAFLGGLSLSTGLGKRKA